MNTAQPQQRRRRGRCGVGPAGVGPSASDPGVGRGTMRRVGWVMRPGPAMPVLPCRHRCRVVVVLGHSGGVVAPEPLDPPAAQRRSGDAAMKPATEPDRCHRTHRRPGHRSAAPGGPGRPPGTSGRARRGLADSAPSVRATALGALSGSAPSPTTSCRQRWPTRPPRSAAGPASWRPADPVWRSPACWRTPIRRWWRWPPGRWGSERSVRPWALCRRWPRWSRATATRCAGRRRLPPWGPSATRPACLPCSAALDDKPADTAPRRGGPRRLRGASGRGGPATVPRRPRLAGPPGGRGPAGGGVIPPPARSGR